MVITHHGNAELDGICQLLFLLRLFKPLIWIYKQDLTYPNAVVDSSFFFKKRSALLCRKWSPNKLSLTPNIKLFVYGCVCIPLYIFRLLQLLYPLFQRCLHFVFSLIVHYDYYYIDRCFTRRAIVVMLASFKLCCSPVDDVTNAKSQFSSNLV